MQIEHPFSPFGALASSRFSTHRQAKHQHRKVAYPIGNSISHLPVMFRQLDYRYCMHHPTQFGIEFRINLDFEYARSQPYMVLA
jgi:hypothetical protein